MEKKECMYCENEKTIDNFSIYRKKYNDYCNDCRPTHLKEMKKKHNENYKIKNPDYQKNYKEAHRDEINRKAREKYKKDPTKKNESNKKYLKNNRNARLAANLRSRLSKALKDKNKSKKTLEYLGCTSEFYKKYLEENWEEGMSWDNYGLKSKKNPYWEIDHTICLDAFDLEDELQLAEAANYLNTKPMWRDENIKKSNNLDEKAIEKLSFYNTDEYISILKKHHKEKKNKDEMSVIEKLKEKYNLKEILYKNIPKEIRIKYYGKYIESINAEIIDFDYKKNISIRCNYDCKCLTEIKFSDIKKKKNWYCYKIDQKDNMLFDDYLLSVKDDIKKDFINLKANYINNIESQLCDECENELPISCFHKNINKYIDGFSKTCKDCSKNKNDDEKQINSLDSDSRLEYLNKLINEKEGTLLSKDYKNRDSLITIKCNKNHIWETKASNILKGHWCKECSKSNSYKDEINESRANSLSDYYKSETGKNNKALAHQKRSETMKARSDELKKNIKNKRCSQCTIVKEIALFNKRKTSKDGYNGICKECSINNRKKYRNSDIENINNNIQNRLQDELHNIILDIVKEKT